MFTRKINLQTKLMMLFIMIPLYFYCGSIIATAFIKFCVIQFSLSIDANMATCLLNLILDLTYVLLAGLIFKDQLIEQLKDFKKDLKANLIYGVFIGTALVYGLCIVGSLITMLLGSAASSQNQTLIEELIKQHPLMLVTASVILAPIFEELLFRGTIFAWAYEIHPIVGHIVSGFLFGFVHVMDSVLSGNINELIQIFPYFFMGIALSYMYEKRNNIYVPILSHATNNLISVIMILL